MKNTAGQTIIKVDKTKLTGQPNSITQFIGRNGGIERNYYDNSGKQTKQISNYDHGNRKRHPYGKNGEHGHDYVYDESGKLIMRTTRELTDEERRENDDIL